MKAFDMLSPLFSMTRPLGCRIAQIVAAFGIASQRILDGLPNFRQPLWKFRL